MRTVDRPAYATSASRLPANPNGATRTAHRLPVSISIDGPREVHDSFRDSHGGRAGFDQVMHDLAHLRAGGVSYSVLTTVHAANENRGVEVYRFLRDDCGAQFMRFMPMVEPVGAGVSGRSVSAEGYGCFLIDVFEEWVRRDVGSVSVQTFDGALTDWVGDEPGYPFANLADHQAARLLAADAQGRRDLDPLPRYCRECEVRFACRGGRPQDRFAVAPDGEPGLNYLCPSFKRFFGHVNRAMRLMAELLAVEHAPVEIVEIYAQADATRRRNGPCTCGSDRAFKRCHGRATAFAHR